MKICIIDTLGLAFDGSTLNKRGLGGSESAVILMAKELAKLDFDVTVYNDCTSDDNYQGVYDGVSYIPLEFAEGEYDIAIGVRSVAAFVPDYLRQQCKNHERFPDFDKLKAKYKVLWMHDTFCDGDHLVEECVNRGLIDKIFTLSDFHTSYITNCDHGAKRNFEVLKDKIFQTRNGIVKYTDFIDIKQKDPNLFVYNASVTKGMVPLLTEIWPEVRKQCPEARLVVIGGFYKFREEHGPDQQENDWNGLYHEYAGKDGITFTGVIQQSAISEILEKASFMIYPAAFPETFGISTLEALAHNVPIITCQFGALEETAIDLASYKIRYAIEPNNLFPHLDKNYQQAHFISTVVEAYNNKYLHQQKMYACNVVKDICTWDTVALQWKQHFYKALDEYLDVDEYRTVTRINNKVAKVFGRRFSNPETHSFAKPEMFQKIHVVTPVYNAEDYIENCIRSVAAQDYNNYHMYIIDDASTDNTYHIAERTILSFDEKLQEKFTLKRNDENVGALANQIKVIDGRGDGIIMLLDGDDRLVNDPSIFNYYSQLYMDGAEFTYGSCWSDADEIPLISQEYPPEVKANKSYRDYKFTWNMPYTHLRTFSGWLALSYLHEKGYWAFKKDHEFIRAGGDAALFYELIEYAEPEKIVCVPHVMVHYNDKNPINDYKINGDEQTRNANSVLSKTSDKKKILIAIPTAKYIEPDCFKAIYDLEVPEGYETDFQYFYGYNIDQIRNLIASWSMRYDYLFSVDSDISFPKDTLKRLIDADKDIVCGVYRQRLPEEAIEIYDFDFKRISYDQIASGDLVEIGGCGMGCALIKSEVFRAITYPHFEYHHALDHANTFSEDLDFCKKARAAGFTVWAIPDLLCDHHGNRIFKIEPRDRRLDETKEQKRLRELSNQRLLPQQHTEFLYKLAREHNYRIIYDIGSCVLHWTNEAKQAWPNAQFYLFEAMEEVKFLYDETPHEYHLGVLSHENGTLVEFNQNLEHPGGNSYYAENPQLSPMANELWKDENKILRQTITLDTIVQTKQYPWPDLIKMDVQGAEKDILMGAQSCLKHAKALILELQHEDYNIGAPKKDEVIRYLNELGWKCEGMFCGSDLGVDGDYFFVRKPRF